MLPPSGPSARRNFSLSVVVPEGPPVTAPELLAGQCDLSRIALKDAMQKGAVWVVPPARRPQRLRRASTRLTAGDELRLHYDSVILGTDAPVARRLADHRRYSVWFKPAGLMVEGSRYGDHATLLRQTELGFAPPRRCWLIHRLDREANGLVLIAHTPDAAARLSALFQTRTIDKRYLIEVRGRIDGPGSTGEWRGDVDGKPASTFWRVLESNTDCSRLEISMATGRHHQIRRHAEAAGHPVLGDPRYGSDNPHAHGLRLAAVGLAFVDPWSGVPMRFSCEDEVREAWAWNSISVLQATPPEPRQ